MLPLRRVLRADGQLWGNVFSGMAVVACRTEEWLSVKVCRAGFPASPPYGYPPPP